MDKPLDTKDNKKVSPVSSNNTKIDDKYIDENLDSIASSMIKPYDSDNKEEITYQNNALMKLKYLALEKKEKEFKSGVQRFNIHYKQLLELKDIHKKGFFLPSMGLTKDNKICPLPNEKIPQYFSCLKCCSSKCNNESKLMAVFQFDNNNELVDTLWTTTSAASTEATADAAVPDPEKMLQISHAFNLRSTYVNWDGTYRETYPGDPIPGYGGNTVNYNYKTLCNTEGVKVVDNSTGPVNHGEEITCKSINLPVKKNIQFKCGCKNHFKRNFAREVNPFGNSCENQPLISKAKSRTEHKYVFHPLNSNDRKHENNIVFFCYGCKNFFRYECLRSINEENNISSTGWCLNVNENILKTLPAINQSMIFRKSLFNDQYSNLLEETARSFEVGVKIERGKAFYSYQFKLFGGMVKYEYLKNLATTAASLAVGVPYLTGGGGIKQSSTPQMGGAYRRGVSQAPPIRLLGSMAASSSSLSSDWESSSSSDFDELSPSARIGGPPPVSSVASVSGASTGVGGVEDEIERTVREIEDMLDKIDDEGGELREELNRILNSGGDFEDDISVEVGGKRKVKSGCPFEDDLRLFLSKIKIIKKGNSGNTIFDENTTISTSLSIGGKYKDLQVFDKFKDFMNELKKWKICENEEAMLTKYSDIKQNKSEIVGVEQSTIDKYQSRYKSLQDGYIDDFNNNTSSFPEYFPFQSKDFDFLLGLKAREDNSTNSYTENKEIKFWGAQTKLRSLQETVNRQNLKDVNNDEKEIIYNLRTYLNDKKNVDVTKSDTIRQLLNLMGVQLDGFSLQDGNAIIRRFVEKNPGLNSILKLNNRYSNESYFEYNYTGVRNLILNNTPVPNFHFRDVHPSGLQSLEQFMVAGGVDKYKRIEKVIKYWNEFVELGEKLKEKYKQDKAKLDEELKQSSSKRRVDPKQYKEVLARMCGKNSTLFWYGNEGDKDGVYDELRSLLSKYDILYLPWIDLNLLKDYLEIKGQANGSFPLLKQEEYGQVGGAAPEPEPEPETKIEALISKLNQLGDIEAYNKEILPLYDLLEVGKTQTQLVTNNGSQKAGHVVKQLSGTGNILSNHSLTLKFSFQGPKDINGVDILSPIELLEIKNNLLKLASNFYKIKESLDRDIKLLKQYEGKDKGESVETSEKETITDKSMSEKETTTEQQKSEIPSEQTKNISTEKDETTLEKPSVSETTLDQSSTSEKGKEDVDTKSDKIYVKEDLIKVSNELDRLRNESKRKEEILKNLFKNIKLLKAQRHGEDSEQRQIQIQEYGRKEKELILIQKLIEQREEKLKILKILSDKITKQNEMEFSEKARRDEADERENLLSFQNKINNITEKQSREMSETAFDFQSEEINQLQDELNDLEEDETDIKYKLVQSGGGSKRKDKLSGLLFKTYSRANRTKKKNKRDNIRKKDRSLRKRN